MTSQILRTIAVASVLAPTVAVISGAIAQDSTYDRSSYRSHTYRYRRHHVAHPRSVPGKTDQFSKNVNHEANRESKDFNHTTNRWSKNVNHFFQGKNRH